VQENRRELRQKSDAAYHSLMAAADIENQLSLVRAAAQLTVTDGTGTEAQLTLVLAVNLANQ